MFVDRGLRPIQNIRQNGTYVLTNNLVLQVFYNLGTLPEVLNKLLENCHNKLRTQATDLMDIR